MLLDALTEVIETLKGRIADHGPTLSVSETRTRVALIDPLLQVLGWDTTDPSFVVPEYDVNGRKADYALLAQNGLPAAIVEAKRLGQPLQPFLAQLIKNAEMVGVEFAWITDGDQWELYFVPPGDSLEEGQKLDLKISAFPTCLSTLSLLSLWQPSLSLGQVVLATEPITVPSSEVYLVPNEPDSTDWVPLSKFVALKATKRPEVIRFPDGSEHRLQAWYELVLQTIEWLWSKGVLTLDSISDFSTSDRHLFHANAVHPSGKPFFSPKLVTGTPLIVETNMSSSSSAKKTKALLSHCGQDLSRVHLGVKRK